MKQSQLFTKTRKEAPKDEVSKNAELLIRAGFIHKEMAGVYSYLPLGLRVLKNIERIIREEMNALGGQEVLLTTLQNKESWQKTGRFDDAVIDNWFKTKLKNDTELGLANTHEEPLSALLTNFAKSFRDFPLYIYQIQTKFRNESRAKSGIMRGREFLMKDLYSFSRDQKEHDVFYEKAKNAYHKIFTRVGLGGQTYETFASGGSFAKYSHEFQTVTDAGEDIIYIDEKKRIAVNKEVLAPEVLKELGLEKKDLVEKKAVEVGNIFSLGTRFSLPLGLFYTDEKGEKKPVIIGSYGIGLGRLMGTVVEVLSDEKGIIWPESIAPFTVHLVSLLGDKVDVRTYADNLYLKLEKSGVSVLYDDRDLRPGEKFADSDLIGIPNRAIISERGMKDDKIEWKNRETGDIEMIDEKEFFRRVPRTVHV
ncbi:MAG: prolyl-tRNA synthetase [Candidatus Taylorbacteria bacterium RIFCSPHIGHO2_01_FULL_45_63]|uniref:Proline--tRNA ligase n=1 Tax=Candidatus Taylorbacteria bacterium RIFCSPHIGHO2_02_FULL_45_35 TaxID=1802311 RepID=A0A1G2MXY9_9BACT|nr:MAG: prolyl-tRNA synthetase [Candidatus Taylorbacteria bacterium RIFCSPHIGHO2_01_FULL_45_63]OHA28069.1 MAG: prolyl-tRNA synthetase [Candidatus Taylorbacteria bacterium RIFCSPHIGHO2_02_FULL_45_35]OHA34894.1 MAG: prolyl-tRNA synthetase [Candidatus Taylorbacteria bacterium RIFCSPLOWO2_01_FULL_45_34b]